MLTGVFANNFALQIIQIDGSTEVPVGFVFASPGTGLGTQVQRWVLYRGFSSKVGDVIELRCPKDTSRQYTSFAAWRDALNGNTGLWMNGATYVKVNTSVSGLGGLVAPYQQRPPAISGPRTLAANTGTTEPRDPPRRVGRKPVEAKPGANRPTDKAPLPKPPLPQFQDLVQITQKGAIIGLAQGTAYYEQESLEGTIVINEEKWALLPQYQYPLSEGGELVTTLRFNEKGTLEAFSEAVKQMGGDATLIDATCSYFSALPENL